jgi:hypothetical protein
MNSLVILPAIVLVLKNMSFAHFFGPQKGSTYCSCEEKMHVRATDVKESDTIE